GLYLATVAGSTACREAEGWDVSPESLAQTRASLERMGVTAPVKLIARDVQAETDPSGEAFDVIVISEVLEHLEHPDRALRALRRFLAPSGRILVNVPVNSPAPDHIFLLDSPEAAGRLVESAGLRVRSLQAFPATGYTLARAAAARATVSCGIV